MNARLTELLVKPDLLEHKDIELIEYQIAAAPYMQSLRALHLLGVQKFQADNYNAALSKTAAYTTDKKILYNLLNPQQKEIPVLEEAHIEQKKDQLLAKEIALKTDSSVFEQQLADNLVTLPEISVNGERNRVLFPGEENFMNEIAPKIDREATREAGRIVLENPSQKAEEVKQDPVPHKDLKNAKTDQPQVADSTVSLYDMAAFLPGVTFKAPGLAKTQPKKEETSAKTDAEKIREEEKTEQEEILRIEEPEIPQEPIEVPAEEPQEPQEIPVEEPVKSERPDEKTEETAEWKPMNFSFNVPDALLAKEKAKPQINILPEPKRDSESLHPAATPVYVETVEETATSEILEIEDLPEINLSFTTSELPPLPQVSETSLYTQETEKVEPKTDESNVAAFINTWQNWLKINREERQEPKLQKTEVIDKFIETNPKISQLKEESTFVVKEKSNDISHLMTETLARLYFEQKLYSKAIKAYQILQEKHPEKKDQFDEVIAKIKDVRSGNK